MTGDPLSAAAIGAVDHDGTLGEILDLPEHLRDALWRVESANLAPAASPGGLQIVGVDGLQQGGELAREALIPGLRGPLTVWEGPPAPAGEHTTVLLASYSGEDPAVLDAFLAARDARRVVLTTGGALAVAARDARVPVVPLPGGFPEPRLALGYPLVVCLELARLGGIAENSAATVEAAAAHVARLARAWGPASDADSPLKRTARARESDPTAEWSPSPVDAGETRLQRVTTRLLAEHLLDLYLKVLAAG